MKTNLSKHNESQCFTKRWLLLNGLIKIDSWNYLSIYVFEERVNLTADAKRSHVYRVVGIYFTYVADFL